MIVYVCQMDGDHISDRYMLSRTEVFQLRNPDSRLVWRSGAHSYHDQARDVDRMHFHHTIMYTPQTKHITCHAYDNDIHHVHPWSDCIEVCAEIEEGRRGGRGTSRASVGRTKKRNRIGWTWLEKKEGNRYP